MSYLHIYITINKFIIYQHDLQIYRCTRNTTNHHCKGPVNQQWQHSFDSCRSRQGNVNIWYVSRRLTGCRRPFHWKSSDLHGMIQCYMSPTAVSTGEWWGAAGVESCRPSGNCALTGAADAGCTPALDPSCPPDWSHLADLERPRRQGSVQASAVPDMNPRFDRPWRWPRAESSQWPRLPAASRQPPTTLGTDSHHTSSERLQCTRTAARTTAHHSIRISFTDWLDTRGVVTGWTGWTCPSHFCQKSFLRLMQIRWVFTREETGWGAGHGLGLDKANLLLPLGTKS